MALAQPIYLDLLGIPFERGGRGPATYDCYGLVREMFRRDGIDLPDFASPGSVKEIAELIKLKERQWRRVGYGTPRSLVTFRVEGVGSHVGYVIGNDRFVHAIEHSGVTTERLTNGEMKPLGFYIYG